MYLPDDEGVLQCVVHTPHKGSTKILLRGYNGSDLQQSTIICKLCKKMVKTKGGKLASSLKEKRNT